MTSQNTFASIDAFRKGSIGIDQMESKAEGIRPETRTMNRSSLNGSPLPNSNGEYLFLPLQKKIF